MTIPDRFYRIAKHKLGEIKDWFDKVDEEEEFEGEAQRRRADPRTEADREIGDALRPSSTGRDTAAIPVSPPRNQPAAPNYGRTAPHTPAYSTGTGSSGGSAPSNSAATSSQTDPLDYHYKLLGLESGADFAAVQSAYGKLAARCDPARFPAGSSEEQQARQIRQRLDTSFKQLRESLDSTSTRFGLLEF